MEILHEQSPPGTVVELHNATLVGVGAGRGILIDRAQGKLGAVLSDAVFLVARHLCQGGGMVSVGFIGSDDTRLIRAPDVFGARAECAAVGLVVGADEVVHAIDFIHVVSFPDTVSFGDDGACGSFYGTTHVGLQFRTFHLSVSVDGIDFPIVVEEYAQVVDVTLHVVMLPRPADILGGIALQSFAVDVGIDIEHSVGIADARGPDALTINLLVVAQGEGVILEVEAVEAIGYVFPIDKILGM